MQASQSVIHNLFRDVLGKLATCAAVIATIGYVQGAVFAFTRLCGVRASGWPLGCEVPISMGWKSAQNLIIARRVGFYVLYVRDFAVRP